MPPIKNSNVLDNNVKKAFDEWNEAMKLSIQSLNAIIEEGKEVNSLFKNADGIKAYNEALSKLNKNRKDAKTTSKEQINLLKQEEQLKQQIAKTTATQERAIQAKNRTQIQESKELDRLLKLEQKQLNQTAKLTSAYAKLSKQLTENRNRAKDLAVQIDQNTEKYGKKSKQVKALQREYDKLSSSVNKTDARLKQIDSGLGQSNRFVGQYEKGIGKLTGGFKGLAGALGFIGGLQLFANILIDGVKKMREYTKMQKTLQKQFKLTKEEASSASKEILLLSSNYDEATNEILAAANALSKEFSISLGRSLELINEGFEKGANTSGDFIEQLKEYPAQLRTVGLTADQTIAIISQSVTEGIFSDKGVDAIKEAGLRLRELPKATRDALAGIGLSSTEIEKSLRSGSKTIFEVIQQVSEKLNDLPPQSAQVGAAIADIFGGPGEDAGLRYLKSLKDIDLNLKNLKSTIDDTKKAQNEFNESWLNLVTNLSDSETGIGRLGASITRFFSRAINQVANIDLAFKGLFKGLDEFSDKDLFRLIDQGDLNNNEKIIDVINRAASNYEKLPPKAKEAITYNQFLFETFYQLGESIEDATIVADFYIKNQDKFTSSTKENTKATNENNEAKTKEIAIISDLIKIQEGELKKANELPGATKKDISFRNARIKAINEEIARLKELGTIDESKISAKSSLPETDIDAINEKALEKARNMEERKTEITKEGEEKRREIKEEFAKIGFQIASDFTELGFELRSQRREEEADAELIALDEKNQRELDAIDARLENEMLDDEQRAELQKQRDTKEKANQDAKEKREKELRTKNAKADKKDALFKVAINTALAIIKQLATTPLPLGAPFIAAVAAGGAAQAALIAARPIPQFDKGTESAPRGGFIVAEKGSELVEKGGITNLITEPTFMGDDMAGAKVISRIETAKILEQQSRRGIVNQTPSKQDNGLMYQIAIDKAMGKHTAKITAKLDQLKPKGQSGLERLNQTKHLIAKYRQ